MIKLLLADDHQVVREAFASLLNEIKGVKVVGLAKNGIEALDFTAKHEVDIAILDVDMPAMGGLAAIVEFRSRHPHVKVIFLSAFSKKSIVKQAHDLNVDGYILKDNSIDELKNAIFEVMAGEVYYTKEVEDVVMEIFKSPKSVDIIKLTEREQDVLRLMCDDKNTIEIAEELGISKNTVNIYRAKLIEKTGLKTASGLAVFAQRNNLI